MYHIKIQHSFYPLGLCSVEEERRRDVIVAMQELQTHLVIFTL